MPAMMVASVHGDAIRSEQANTVTASAGYSSEEREAPEVSLENADAVESPSVKLPRLAPTEWTKVMERRFDELSRFEALGTITKEQYFELERLTNERRHLVNPRTEDEIFWEYKERQMTAKLTAVLQEYVEFQKSKNH